jgi:hypothetical protein
LDKKEKYEVYAESYIGRAENMDERTGTIIIIGSIRSVKRNPAIHFEARTNKM